MFRGRGGRPVSGTGRPRRNKDWYHASFSGVTAAGTPECAWLIAPSLIDVELTDPTVFALRVSVAALSTAAVNSNDAVFAAGIIAWNFVDDTVPTQCPNLLGANSSSDSDWLYTWYAPGVSSGLVQLSENGGNDIDSESKAKRKLGNDRALLIVVESAVNNFNYHLHARVLIAE